MNTKVNHNRAERIFKWLDRGNALLFVSLVLVILLAGCYGEVEVEDETKVDAETEVTAEAEGDSNIKPGGTQQVSATSKSNIKIEVTEDLNKRYNRLLYAYEQLSLELEINKVPRITGAEDARVELAAYKEVSQKMMPRLEAASEEAWASTTAETKAKLDAFEEKMLEIGARFNIEVEM